MKYVWILAAHLFAVVINFTNPANAQTTAFFTPSGLYRPTDVVGGPDGNIWFTSQNAIGYVTPAGVLKQFFTYSLGNTAGAITTGADGNLWVASSSGPNLYRVTPLGVIKRFSLFPFSSSVLADLVAGADGNIWFTEYTSRKIGRLTQAGDLKEYPLPNNIPGSPGVMTAAPDGSIWFTITSSSATHIGRITLQGEITTFSLSGAYGLNSIASDKNGNLWFLETVLNAVGRMTPTGVITRFGLPTRGADPGDIALGPDGNMWFTEYRSMKIGRVTAEGVITEFDGPDVPAGTYVRTGPTNITSGPDGNMWFVADLYNSALGNISVPSTGLHVGPVLSSTQGSSRAILQVYNAGTAAGTIEVALSNSQTGSELAKWTSPSVAAGAELEFDISTIENGAAPGFTKPASYGLIVKTAMPGYMRHIVARKNDGAPSNVTACVSGPITPRKLATGVYSSLAGNTSSLLVIHNTSFKAKTIKLGIYDARNGTKRGVFTTPPVPSNGQAAVTIAAIEGVIGKPTIGMTRYVIKAETVFAGYIQNLAVSGDVTTDMTPSCYLQPETQPAITNITEYAPPTKGSAPNTLALGPDGNMWFTQAGAASIARVDNDGAITEFKIGDRNIVPRSLVKADDTYMYFSTLNSSMLSRINTKTGKIDVAESDYNGHNPYDLVVAADGGIWFSGDRVSEIGRAGSSKSYTPPSKGKVRGITLGPDGNLWFAQSLGPGSTAAYVGRITPSGAITEFQTARETTDITSGSDGNLWAGSYGKIFQISTAGAVKEFSIGNSSADSVTSGADGNIWFVDSANGQIGGMTLGGKVTKYDIPTRRNLSTSIASGADGDLWVNVLGSDLVARMPLPLAGLHAGGVLSTKHASDLSFLRVFNTDDKAGPVTVILANAKTGAAIATWKSASIAAGVEKQFSIAEIEAQAGVVPAVRPDVYSITVEAAFAGRFQHVIWRSADGLLYNATACDGDVQVAHKVLPGVHSSAFKNNYPSSVIVTNGAPREKTIPLSIYDADDGRKLGMFTTPVIRPNGQLVLSTSTLEAEARIAPGSLRYVVKADGVFNGYLQLLLTNLQPGVSTDMSAACLLR